jgi:hypothetical protein
MVEQTTTPDEARFGDVYQSRFYQFGHEIHIAGDPETPDDFLRAQDYLETITARALQHGTLWDMKPTDVVAELDYHNAWLQYETEQERKTGEKTAEYRAVTLHQLQALARRRVLAFEDTGWEVTHDYKVVTHIHSLVEQALLEQEQFEQMMATAAPEYATPIQSSPNPSDDVPF